MVLCVEGVRDVGVQRDAVLARADLEDLLHAQVEDVLALAAPVPPRLQQHAAAGEVAGKLITLAANCWNGVYGRPLSAAEVGVEADLDHRDLDPEHDLELVAPAVGQLAVGVDQDDVRGLVLPRARRRRWWSCWPRTSASLLLSMVPYALERT